MEFTPSDIIDAVIAYFASYGPSLQQLSVVVPQLVIATQYTIYLSLIAFFGGGAVAAFIALLSTFTKQFSFAPNGPEASSALMWRLHSLHHKIRSMSVLGLLYRLLVSLTLLISRVYVWLFQSTPLLMLLFFFNFVIPVVYEVRVTAWQAATAAMVIYASAYLADVWRGALDAVERGQWEGGAALGLPFLATLRRIVLPQALRFAAAPTVGFMVQIIKGTSLAYIIGFYDLMNVGKRWANASVQHTEPFVIYPIVGLMYFLLCFPLSVWARRLEKRLAAARDRPQESLPDAPATMPPTIANR